MYLYYKYYKYKYFKYYYMDLTTPNHNEYVTISDSESPNITKNTDVTETNDCPICLCPLENNDKTIIIVTCCNNKFHNNCYLSCMALKKQCPLCRKLLENPTNSATSNNLQQTYPTYQTQNVQQTQNANNMSDTILNVRLDLSEEDNMERKRIRYYICFIGFIGLTLYMRH